MALADRASARLFCVIACMSGIALTPSSDASAHAEIHTTKGTSDDDLLTGTSGRDRILGLGGGDYIYSHGKSDFVGGGPGSDFIRPAGGADVVHGGRGPDRIEVFRDRKRDVIDCGKGHDVFVWINHGEKRDHVRRCEEVFVEIHGRTVQLAR